MPGARRLLVAADNGNAGRAVITRFSPSGEVGGEPVKILVVEDDPAMQGVIMEFLKQQNMHVVAASGRQDALSGLTLCEPRLVTLDLHPVRDDGLDLLRDIRSRSDVPVIVITGDQGGEVDRVVGLELGADDCVTKPFSLRELLARIRAVLRRQMIVHAAPRESERGRCRFGGWQLDRRFRLLTNSHGASVVLTKREYGLLIAFLDAPQRALTREHLMQATRVHEDVFDRSIDVQVLRLRRKLEADPGAPTIIKTERGVGYVFAVAVEPF